MSCACLVCARPQILLQILGGHLAAAVGNLLVGLAMVLITGLGYGG